MKIKKMIMGEAKQRMALLGTVELRSAEKMESISHFTSNESFVFSLQKSKIQRARM